MFTQNRQANAEAQTGAAAGTLGGEEGIKNLGENVTPNPGAIVLKGGHDTVGGTADTDTNGPMIANLSNGLLGVSDNVQENLGELASVAQNQWKIGSGGKINRDAIRAQGMFVKLESALNQFTQVEANFARLGRARKGQETLHDLSGPAGL